MDKKIKIVHIITTFVLLILIFFVGYASYQGMNEVEKKSRAIHNMTFIANNMQGALEAEESYVIHGDPINKEEVNFHLDLVSTQAAISREIYMGYLDPVNQNRMDSILANSNDFKEAFDRYVEADDEEIAVRTKMVSNGEHLLQKADEIYQDQMNQYQQYVKNGSSSEVLQLKLSNAQEAQKMSILAMEARNEYQNYIITPENQSTEEFDQLMVDLISVTENLNEQMVKPENIERGNIIIASAREIQSDFERLKALKELKADEVDTMAIIAAQVGEVAQASIASLETDEGANTDTKEETSNEEKTVFDIYFLKNLISESVVAFITGLLGLVGTIIVTVYFNKRTNEKN